nr:hypothetical protein [Tanacetum cinerariifolium]
ESLLGLILYRTHWPIKGVLRAPTKPHHTPSPQEHHSPQHDYPPLSHQPFIPEPIPPNLRAPTKTLTPRRLTKRAIRIAQSKALSPAADEPASLSRYERHGKAFPTVSSLDAGQDRENIAKTSAMSHESSPRVPSLNADEGKDAPITRGIIDIGEELGVDKNTEKGSNDTEEMVNMLSSMEAANILSSGGAAASVSSVDVFLTAGVPTVSGSFPTVSVIFTTASVEQIDAQVAREMEEEFARENQRSNEVIAKHLSEYEQAEADLSVGEKIELISELVKYQDHRAKIFKYQAQQSKPLSKKEQREFYMSEDFVPMSSKEEIERVKRPGIKLDQGSSKRVKISHTSKLKPSQEQQFKGSEGVSEEELKGMM